MIKKANRRLNTFVSSTSGESEAELGQHSDNKVGKAPIEARIKFIDSDYGSALDVDIVGKVRIVDEVEGKEQESEEEVEEDIFLMKDLESKDYEIESPRRKGKETRIGENRSGKKVKLQFRTSIPSNINLESSESDEESGEEEDRTREKSGQGVTHQQQISTKSIVMDYDDDSDSDDADEEMEEQDYERDFDPDIIRIINENYRTREDDQYDVAFDMLYKVFEKTRSAPKKKSRYDIHGRNAKSRKRVDIGTKSIMSGRSLVDNEKDNMYRSLRPNKHSHSLHDQEKAARMDNEHFSALSPRTASEGYFRIALEEQENKGQQKGKKQVNYAIEQRKLKSIIDENAIFNEDSSIAETTGNRFENAIKEFGLDKMFNAPKLYRTDGEWRAKLDQFRILEKRKQRKIDKLRRKMERKEQKLCTFQPRINQNYNDGAFFSEKVNSMSPLHERYRKVMKAKERNRRKLAISLEKHRKKEHTFSPKINKRKGSRFDDVRENDWSLNKFEIWEKERKKKIETKRNLMKQHRRRKRKDYFKPRKFVSEERTQKLMKKRRKRYDINKNDLNGTNSTVFSINNSSSIMSNNLINSSIVSSQSLKLHENNKNVDMMMGKNKNVVNGPNVFDRNYYEERRRRRNNRLKKRKENHEIWSQQHETQYNKRKKKMWMLQFDQQDREEEEFRKLLQRYRSSNNSMM